MAKQKEFTQVRKHKRSNPVQPGTHWVKKHPRFIGYRDDLEVKLLGASHIADIKGVGGKTAKILEANGYLTMADLDRLSKDPAAQKALMNAGVRPHVMRQMLKTTGVTVLEPVPTKAPKAPPKVIRTIEKDVIGAGKLTEEKLLQRWGWIQDITDDEGKPISKELATRELIRHLNKDRKLDIDENAVRAWVAKQTPRKVQRADINLTKKQILEGLKDNPTKYAKVIERNVKEENKSFIKALNALVTENKVQESRITGYYQLIENKEYAKKKINEYRETDTWGMTTEQLWEQVLKRPEIRIDQGTFGAIIGELERDGEIKTNLWWDGGKHHTRINWITEGGKKKKDLIREIERARSEQDLTDVTFKLRTDRDTEAYRDTLKTMIEKRRDTLHTAKGLRWLRKIQRNPKRKTIIERWFKRWNLSKENERDAAREGYAKGFMMDPARVMALQTTDQPLHNMTEGVTYRAITINRAIKKKQLEEHDHAFGIFAPHAMWEAYKIMGRGATYHVPEDPKPMYVEKDGMRLYIAPRLKQDYEKNETEESWAKKQHDAFFKDLPEYAQETKRKPPVERNYLPMMSYPVKADAKKKAKAVRAGGRYAKIGKDKDNPGFWVVLVSEKK